MSTSTRLPAHWLAWPMAPEGVLPIPHDHRGNLKHADLTREQRTWLNTLPGIRHRVRLQQQASIRDGFRPDRSMDEFLDQLDGLDLTPAELSTVSWFVGWDANGNMASILGKARAAGPVTT